MIDKSSVRKLVHDLSNKFMILDGYLAIMGLQPESITQDNIISFEKTLSSAVEILDGMRTKLDQDFVSPKLMSLTFLTTQGSKLKESDFMYPQAIINSSNDNQASEVSGFDLSINDYSIYHIEGKRQDLESFFLTLSLNQQYIKASILCFDEIDSRSFKYWNKLDSTNLDGIDIPPNVRELLLLEQPHQFTSAELLTLSKFICYISETPENTPASRGHINGH